MLLGAAKRLVDDWEGNQFAGLYLYGEPGNGKTHAAVGLGRQLHDAGAEVYYHFMPGEDSKIPKAVSYWTSARSRSYKGEVVGGVFPSSYTVAGERNPKTVLILDDYQPEKQRTVLAATEAAAQFGGLVIITSNYSDPFKLVEVEPQRPSHLQELATETMVEQVNPEAVAELNERRQAAAAEISASLRSRLAAGFKFVEFTGSDRRVENSFWNE